LVAVLADVLSSAEDSKERKGNDTMNRLEMIGIALMIPILAGAQSRGIELYKQGKYGEAAKALSGEVQSSPEDVQKLTYLGLARAYAGDANGALEPLKKAVGKDGDYAEAHYGLGFTYVKLKNLDQGIPELEKAVTLAPDHAYGHYYLGMAYNQSGKKERAVLQLRRFLELAPNSPEAPAVKSFLSKM
jgi:tetratricopeptide (TPR) repeat protein